MKAYLDTLTNTIITTDEWKALELDTYPMDMGLEPVFKGAFWPVVLATTKALPLFPLRGHHGALMKRI